MLLDAPSLTPEETAFVKRSHAIVPRSPKDMTSLRRRFARAGYYTLTPIAVYTLAQIVLPVVFGLAAVLYFHPHGTRPSCSCCIGAMLGFLLPAFWL